jgi:hypothetical protein
MYDNRFCPFRQDNSAFCSVFIYIFEYREYNNLPVFEKKKVYFHVN